jgi:hypothetical protein
LLIVVPVISLPSSYNEGVVPAMDDTKKGRPLLERPPFFTLGFCYLRWLDLQ